MHEPTVETALLDAICAAPGSNEPRLVYADWLQQRGDPRGELIVASCTHGGEARAAELLAENPSWWSWLPEWALAAPPLFERGFMAEVYVMGTLDEMLLDFAPDIVTIRPTPVAVILGSKRVLVRADRRVFAWRDLDNHLVICADDFTPLAEVPASPEQLTMLGFVGDRLHYRQGAEVHELACSNLRR